MHPTIEVRWFLGGKPSVEMRRWFERGAIFPTEEGLREDWYLHSTKSPSLGIKLREAKLEIKQRLSNAGIHEFVPDVQGQVETWVKWEFLLDSESGNLPNLSLSDGFWVLVKKQRFSKHYRITGASIEPIEATAQVAQGCTLELTELQVWDQSWHSLGLETLGDVDQTALPQVMQHLLTGFHPSLKATDSYGYPQWLPKILSTYIAVPNDL